MYDGNIGYLCSNPVVAIGHQGTVLRAQVKALTYPADCRKIAAVDSNKHDSD